MAGFLRLIDVNAGSFRLKKGQGILHPTFRSDPLLPVPTFDDMHLHMGCAEILTIFQQCAD